MRITVKDLITKLQDMPQDAPIVLSIWCDETVYRCEYATANPSENIEIYETTEDEVCIQY